MEKRLKGAEVIQELNGQIQEKVEKLKKQGITPCLMILRVGEQPDAIRYERNATKRCETLGILVKNKQYDETITQEQLCEEIIKQNEDNQVHGILLLRPLPNHIKEEVVCNQIAPQKDVDGVTDISLASLVKGEKRGFSPCTPEASMQLLHYYGIDCQGKHVVIIGRSMNVGKPVSMLALQENATITICHTKTNHMQEITKQADILIVAAGKANLIGKDHVTEGQTIIDIGINVDKEQNLCGDVNFNEVHEIVKAITPVPGGVGTVTNSILANHVVCAAQKRLEKMENKQ